MTFTIHVASSENLPGFSSSAFLQILVLRLGKTGSLIIWVFVCATAFFVVQTALQALSRTVYAFSRDHGTVHENFHDITYLAYSKKVFPMEAILEKPRKSRIRLFALSGSRPLPVFFLDCWILPAQSLPMLFSQSQLWRLI
jgi:hypothetical protein